MRRTGDPGCSSTHAVTNMCMVLVITVTEGRLHREPRSSSWLIGPYSIPYRSRDDRHRYVLYAAFLSNDFTSPPTYDFTSI